MGARRLPPLLLLVAALGAGEPPAPVLPEGVQELHGRLRPEGGAESSPVWLRLHPPAAAYGGGRLLELVWEPPPAAVLAGTVLTDTPFVLLAGDGRLRAWNGRQGLSQAEPAAGGGYRVVRAVGEGDGAEAREVPHPVALPGPPAWDRRLAPLLLALAWREGSEASIPVVDLFGPLPPAVLTWRGGAVRLGDLAWRAEAGADGRLQRLGGADGRPLFVREP